MNLLAIGQSKFSNSNINDLNGPAEDLRLMEQIARVNGFSFEKLENADKKAVVDRLKKGGIDILYWSGHGCSNLRYNQQGLVCTGEEDYVLWESELRDLLIDQPVHGIFDTCHSGGMFRFLSRGKIRFSSVQLEAPRTAGPISSIHWKSFTAACHPNQYSIELQFGTKSRGLFTAALWQCHLLGGFTSAHIDLATKQMYSRRNQRSLVQGELPFKIL